VRSVIDTVTPTQTPDGRGGSPILPGQLAYRDAGGCRLDLGTDLRCRCSLLMQLGVLPDELLKKLPGGYQRLTPIGDLSIWDPAGRY